MPRQQLAKEVHKPAMIKLEKRKYIYLLKTIFGVLILLICDQQINIIKGFSFYVLLIFSVNMYRFFL